MLARRKDLLVAGLDLLEADWSTHLLLKPAGERWPVKLEAMHRPEAYLSKRGPRVRLT